MRFPWRVPRTRLSEIEYAIISAARFEFKSLRTNAELSRNASQFGNDVVTSGRDAEEINWIPRVVPFRR